MAGGIIDIPRDAFMIEYESYILNVRSQKTEGSYSTASKSNGCYREVRSHMTESSYSTAYVYIERLL